MSSIYTLGFGTANLFQIFTMSQLWELCRLGQFDRVKEALERGEDVNSLNEANNTDQGV